MKSVFKKITVLLVIINIFLFIFIFIKLRIVNNQINIVTSQLEENTKSNFIEYDLIYEKIDYYQDILKNYGH